MITIAAITVLVLSHLIYRRGKNGCRVSIRFEKIVALRSIVCFLVTAASVAGQEASPDGRYAIEYFEAPPYEANVKFKNAKSGKVLHYAFSSGVGSQPFTEIAWSPDSKYLAVVARGTKTTSGLQLFRFKGDSVTEVRIPDYRLNLLGRRKLVRGGRHHWVSNVRWKENRITFHCRGQWKDGSGDPEVDPDNWYHFDVSLDFFTMKPILAEVKEAGVDDGE